MAVIGVFDSGIGGLSVANAITEAMPEHSVIFKNDTAHMPYANKSSDELLTLVTPILDSLVSEGCEVIVIACNTVTTTIIPELRERIKVPLIGMEPMVKPASELTKSKVIAVCATPTTLASERYKELKQTYAEGITVLEPDCSNWSYLIETDQIDRQAIAATTDEVCSKGADVIVLGCTHYHWIEDLIKEASKSKATVLQPEQPVVAQLERVLANLKP